MTYNTGSITSATPAKALFDLLDPDITGVGYVRVETGHTAGGVTWNVYRSPAASNFFGSDWYFALGYDTTGQTTLYSCVMEDWDGTNKLAIRFAPNTASLVPGTGYINPQAAAALPAGFTLSHALPTTAFTYAYSTLIDRVAIAAWTAVTSPRFGWYIGLYDSFYSTTDDPFPLLACNIGQGNSSNWPSVAQNFGSATREPMTTVANTTNFSAGQVAAHGTDNIDAGKGNWWTQARTNSYQSAPWVSRVVVNGRGGNPSFPRGLFRDLWSTGASLNNGDRVTWSVNGVNYAAVRLSVGGSVAPSVCIGEL